jgi:hypothetical protein|tara:strand:- start:741 stop:992 length:252 start_codon:yes stop_codon:yes gene_type:complete
MTSPGDRSLEVEVQSLDTVRKLYELFDEMGLTHRFSEESGEVEVAIHGVWLLFYANKRVMEEDALLNQAFEDAQMIAEGHWRE